MRLHVASSSAQLPIIIVFSLPIHAVFTRDSWVFFVYSFIFLYTPSNPLSSTLLRAFYCSLLLGFSAFSTRAPCPFGFFVALPAYFTLTSSPLTILHDKTSLGLLADPRILVVGSLSNGSSSSSNLGDMVGNEPQRSATSVVEEEFPFKVLFRKAGESDSSRGLPSWIDPSVARVYSTYTRPESLVGIVDAIYRRGPWSVDVLPYCSDEFVCEWPEDTEGPFFYFYDTLFLKLGVKLPFIDFEWSVLRVLNIAPTQLHPNS
ncbi:hypothetical protein CR513_06446, partial [Mucuna pruriens]